MADYKELFEILTLRVIWKVGQETVLSGNHIFISYAPMKMKAIGTVIEASPDQQLSEYEIWTGLLDYYDHWQSIDARLAEHHDPLSKWAEAFGHDLVNLAPTPTKFLHGSNPTT